MNNEQAQRVLGVRHALSPQQILACDELHGKYCLGGWPEAAYAYVRRAGGLEKEVTYPYASAAGAEPSCTARADNFVVNAADASDSTGALSGYGSSPGYAISRESAKVTELAMAYHVANVGPLVVCIDASGFSTCAFFLLLPAARLNGLWVPFFVALLIHGFIHSLTPSNLPPTFFVHP